MPDYCTHPDHPHEIENEYENSCSDWGYWNEDLRPYASMKDKAWYGKKCKNCTHKEYKRSEKDET